MWLSAYSYLVYWLCGLTAVAAINHWILKDDGRISQKIDSPFYMREPDNLIAFLNQIKYNDYVESSYHQLTRQREQIVDHILFSVKFGEELVDQAKCAMDYYLMEKRMSYLTVSPTYLKRLNLHEPNDPPEKRKPTALEPLCAAFAEAETEAETEAQPFIYDSLESLQPDNVQYIRIDPEEDMTVGEPVSNTVQLIRTLAVDGLKKEPHSWKFHTVGSYYWRLRGDAQHALECARLGIIYAPRAFKDMPLLSMGTTLFRAGRLPDAVVILKDAVKYAPDVPENHISLGSAQAMIHDFNSSLHHFDEAERLDPSLLPRTQPVRNFISCLENLTKKTAKMYSYVEFMKNEVKVFKKLKQQVSLQHEQLMQQQVPLGARSWNDKQSNEDLLRRGQYCSTRTLSTSKEPVLFCDFYSDMQMRLESKDVDIDSLERQLKLTSESLIRQVSAELRKQINFEQMKAQTPPAAINKGAQQE